MPSMMRASVLASGALWILICSSIAAFLAITAIRPTNWFYYNKDFIAARNSSGIRVGSSQAPALGDEEAVVQPTELWNGNQGFVVALQWGSVMLAGMAVAGLKLLKSGQPGDRIYDAASPAPQLDTRWARLTRTARYVATYPLPPRELWSWMCGGMTVLDALIAATWFGITFLYMYYCTIQRLKGVAEEDAKEDVSTGQLALDRMDAAGEGSGTALLWLLMIMFFPVSRSSFLKWVFGSTFHALIKYHRWMAWGTIWIAFGHSCLFFVLWGAEGSLSENLSFQTVAGARNVMGLVSMLLMLLIAATANSWFRNTYFKIFYPVHITCFVIIAAFGIFHSPLMAYWLLPALVLYILDRAFRYWQLASNWTQVTPADFAVDGNIMSLRLRWHKGERVVQPGQTVYLRAPSLSWFYSHPFSVADVEEVGEVLHVTVHIRQVGKWTAGLKERLTQGQSLKLQVEGPYESKLDYLHAAPVVVVIAGGTGVTPVLALLRRWARIALSSSGHVPQVHFVWTSRSLAELRLMGADLLAAASAASSMTTLQPALFKDSNSSSTSEPVSDADSGAIHIPAAPQPIQWLHAALHYTGFEQEQQAASVMVNIAGISKPAKTSLPASFSTLTPAATAVPAGKSPASKVPHIEDETAKPSTQRVVTQLLAAHPGSNPWVYGLSIFMTYTCAWGGFLAGNAFISSGLRHTPNGYFFLANGFMQFTCILLGGILPPFLLQAALHMWRQRKQHAAVVDDDTATASDAGRMHLSSGLTVLPGYVLAPAGTTTEPAASGTLQLGRGRPKVAALLKRVCEQYAHLKEVEVVVAGPDGLCASVQELCAQRCRGAPDLVCHRAAYHQ